MESWRAEPQMTPPHPGKGHASTPSHLLPNLRTTENLITDAHLPALSEEYQATLHTTDADLATAFR